MNDVDSQEFGPLMFSLMASLFWFIDWRKLGVIEEMEIVTPFRLGSDYHE